MSTLAFVALMTRRGSSGTAAPLLTQTLLRGARSSSADGRCFYGVVSAQIEIFLERQGTEAMIGEVREDEPELAEALRVEAIELV
jgi:hypothetical protein